MPSPGDLRAARILLAIAVAGALVRVVDRGPAPPGSVAFRGASDLDRPDRDSVAAAAKRAGQPLRRGERIDPNRATASDLVRLPRIGPALAARIIQYRDSVGVPAFRSIADLEHVSGIGPGLARALSSHVTLALTRETPARSGRGGGSSMLSLNAASADELATLPGIGMVRARAIVDDRNRRGPFRELSDLARVTGIGPATIQRLQGRLRVP